jgi:hypothetical protein
MNQKYSISSAEALDKSGSFPARKTRYTFLSISLVFLAVFVVLFGFGVYRLTVWNVIDFTIKIPVDLPIQPTPEPEQSVFLQEAKQFFDEILKNQVPEEDLVVTSDVINGLIAQSDYLRDHMHVELTPNRLTVKTSLPTDFLPGGKHRFFVSEHFVQVLQGPSGEFVSYYTSDDFTLQWRARPPDVMSEYLAGTFDTAVDLDKIFSILDRPFGDVRFYLSNYYLLGYFEFFLMNMVIFGKDRNFYWKRKETDMLKIIFNNPNTPKILHQGIERIQFEKDRMIIQPRGRSLHTKLGEDRTSLTMYSKVALI